MMGVGPGRDHHMMGVGSGRTRERHMMGVESGLEESAEIAGWGQRESVT